MVINFSHEALAPTARCPVCCPGSDQDLVCELWIIYELGSRAQVGLHQLTPVTELVYNFLNNHDLLSRILSSHQGDSGKHPMGLRIGPAKYLFLLGTHSLCFVLTRSKHTFRRRCLQLSGYRTTYQINIHYFALKMSVKVSRRHGIRRESWGPRSWLF